MRYHQIIREALNPPQGRVTVRSLTRRLAEAGLRVKVWRRASAEEVRRAFEAGEIVLLPVFKQRLFGRNGTGWHTVSKRLVSRGFVKLERLGLELSLREWTPKGTAIICDP